MRVCMRISIYYPWIHNGTCKTLDRTARANAHAHAQTYHHISRRIERGTRVNAHASARFACTRRHYRKRKCACMRAICARARTSKEAQMRTRRCYLRASEASVPPCRSTTVPQCHSAAGPVVPRGRWPRQFSEKKACSKHRAFCIKNTYKLKFFFAHKGYYPRPVSEEATSSTTCRLRWGEPVPR